MEEILEFHCQILVSYLLWFHENIFFQTIILLCQGGTTTLMVLLLALLYSRIYYNRCRTISKLGPSGHLFFLSCGESVSLLIYHTGPMNNRITFFQTVLELQITYLMKRISSFSTGYGGFRKGFLSDIRGLL